MKRMAMAVVWMAAVSAGLGEGETNAAPEAPEAIALDGVAAYVNERVITVSDVLGVIQPVQRQLMGRYRGDELKQRLQEAYSEGLQSLIERNLILDAAVKENLQLPDWVVERYPNPGAKVIPEDAPAQAAS